MHLILAGVTGLVGSSVLSRKPVPVPVPVRHNTQNPRIKIIIHRDFERYDALGAAVGVTAVRLACRIAHSPTEHLGGFMTHMAVGSLDDKLQGAGVFKLGPSWIVDNVGGHLGSGRGYIDSAGQPTVLMRKCWRLLN